ncbi:MAG TPA: ABC transporter substrate-binding protein [Candidatus Binatia bacterium]|nr:ABC transporter substrate-binding protein [Candidatus Binatia bacterium]
MVRFFASTIAAILCSLVIFSSESQGKTVNVAIPCYCFQYIPFFIAKDKGYYRDEDLDVQLIVTGGGIGLRALIGGNVDFAATGEPAVLSAHLSGARLQILLSTYYRPLLWLYSDPKIKSVKELRGKKIGVSGIGSATDALTRDLLKKRGIEAGREVAILAMGSPEARFVALKTGNVDAAVLSEGFKFVADEAGLHELVSFLKEDLILLSGSIGVREASLKLDAASIEQFLRGTVKGLLYAQGNRAGTLPYVIKTLKVKEDLAGKIYDLSLPGFTKGYVNEDLQKEAYSQAIARLGTKNPPPIDRIFNYSIVKKLLAEIEAQGWKPGQ